MIQAPLSRAAVVGGTVPLASYHSALDVGSGSAAELLREGELTQSLLLLYFDNFGDIHFMFDQISLLRQYALGTVPNVILLSMMALGVRSVSPPASCINNAVQHSS